MQVQYFKRRKGQHSLALLCATGVPTTFQSHCETTLHYHCRQSWLLPVKPAFLTNTSQDYQHGLVSAGYCIRDILSASIPGMPRVRSAACVWLKAHVPDRKVLGWYCVCASDVHHSHTPRTMLLYVHGSFHSCTGRGLFEVLTQGAKRNLDQYGWGRLRRVLPELLCCAANLLHR